MRGHFDTAANHDACRSLTGLRDNRDGSQALTPFETVGRGIGVTKQRAEQIERTVLTKLRHAIDIDERLGPVAAAPVLEALRGRGLADFRQAAQMASRRATWKPMLRDPDAPKPRSRKGLGALYRSDRRGQWTRIR